MSITGSNCINIFNRDNNSTDNQQVLNRKSFPGDIQIQLNQELYNKYPSSQNYYYSKDINEILFCQEGTASLIRYKDWQAFDEEIEEYFQELYPLKVYPQKIAYLVEYYKFHNNIPRMFMEPLNHVMNYYHDRQRKIKYVKITRMLKLQQQEQNGQGDQQQQEEDNQDKHSNEQKSESQIETSSGGSIQHLQNNHKKTKESKRFIDASVSMDRLLAPLESFFLNFSQNNRKNKEMNILNRSHNTKSTILDASSKTLVDLQMKLSQIISNQYPRTSDVSMSSSVCTISSNYNNRNNNQQNNNNNSIGNLSKFLKFQDIQHRIALIRNQEQQKSKLQLQTTTKIKVNQQITQNVQQKNQQQISQPQLIFTSASNKITANHNSNNTKNITNINTGTVNLVKALQHALIPQKDTKTQKITYSSPQSSNQFDFLSHISPASQHLSPSAVSILPTNNNNNASQNNKQTNKQSNSPMKNLPNIPILRMPSNSIHNNPSQDAGVSSRLISQKIHEQISQQIKDAQKNTQQTNEINSPQILSPGGGAKRQNVAQRLQINSNKNLDKNNQQQRNVIDNQKAQQQQQQIIYKDHINGSVSARGESTLKRSVEVTKDKTDRYQISKQQQQQYPQTTLASANVSKNINQKMKDHRDISKKLFLDEKENQGTLDLNKEDDQLMLDNEYASLLRNTNSQPENILTSPSLLLSNEYFSNQIPKTQSTLVPSHPRRSSSIHQAQPMPIGLQHQQQQHNTYGARVDGLLNSALVISTVSQQSPSISFPCSPIVQLVSQQQSKQLMSNVISSRQVDRNNSPQTQSSSQASPMRIIPQQQQQNNVKNNNINNIIYASTECASESVSPTSAAVNVAIAKARHQSHHNLFGFTSQQASQELQQQKQLTQQVEQQLRQSQQKRQQSNIEMSNKNNNNNNNIQTLQRVLTERPISPIFSRQPGAITTIPNLSLKTQQTLGRESSNLRLNLNFCNTNLVVSRQTSLPLSNGLLMTEEAIYELASQKKQLQQSKQQQDNNAQKQLNLNLELLESQRINEQLPSRRLSCQDNEDQQKKKKQPTPPITQQLNGIAKQHELTKADIGNKSHNQVNTASNNSSKLLLKCHSAHHSRTGSLKGIDILKIAQQQQQQLKQQLQCQISPKQQTQPSQQQQNGCSSLQSPSVNGNIKQINNYNVIKQSKNQLHIEPKQVGLIQLQESIPNSTSQRGQQSSGCGLIQNTKTIQTLPSSPQHQDQLGSVSQSLQSKDFAAQLQLQQELSQQQHQSIMKQQQLYEQSQLQLQKQIQLQLQQTLILQQQQWQQQQQQQQQQVQQQQQQQIQQLRLPLQQPQYSQGNQLRMHTQQQEQYQSSTSNQTNNNNYMDGFLTDRSHNINGMLKRSDVLLTQPSPKQSLIMETLPTASSMQINRKQIKQQHLRTKSDVISGNIINIPAVSPKNSIQGIKSPGNNNIGMNWNDQGSTKSMKDAQNYQKLQLMNLQKELKGQQQQSQQVGQQQQQKQMQYVKIQRQNSAHQTTSSSLKSTASPMSNINNNSNNNNNNPSNLQSKKDIYFSQLATSSSSFLGHSRTSSIQKIPSSQQQQQIQYPQDSSSPSPSQLLVQQNSAISSNSSKQNTQNNNNNLYQYNPQKTTSISNINNFTMSNSSRNKQQSSLNQQQLF